MSMKELRKNWSITVFGLGIVVISFLICLTVYVLIRYGFEAQEQNIVILVASINLVFTMVLLVVTISSLRLVKRDSKRASDRSCRSVKLRGKATHRR